MCIWRQRAAGLKLAAAKGREVACRRRSGLLDIQGLFAGHAGRARHACLTSSLPRSPPWQETWRGKVEVLSWRPRAYLFHNFLSKEECEHLKAIANGTMHKSKVADSTTGVSVDSSVRTSTGTFLTRGQDAVVNAIEHRIASVTMIPRNHGEGMQLLRYVNGQKYEPHTDYFHDNKNKDADHGGQRLATMLMYLSTPVEGGETVFPRAETKVSGEGWSECALKGLSVKAVEGNALFFYSLKPNGEEDVQSTHGSCPTLAGTKWSATKWMHVAPYRPDEMLDRRDSRCKDKHGRCEEWAIMGECEKNAPYMQENCPASCNLCGRSRGGRKESV